MEMDHIIELCTNLDDMTAEAIGYAMQRLLDEGALDVYGEQILMKKSRPGFKLCVLAKPEDEEQIARAIFRHTSAIGIRRQEMQRYVLSRESRLMQTKYGEVRVKYSTGYGVEKHKIEYTDIARLAAKENRSFLEMQKLLEEEIKGTK
ncbi:MAG: DUF111 family protein [Peptostreptococcaceae bacterium]|nr:DUF111 family protein [Peptostreptococcaceae bacterium]